MPNAFGGRFQGSTERKFWAVFRQSISFFALPLYNKGKQSKNLFPSRNAVPRRLHRKLSAGRHFSRYVLSKAPLIAPHPLRRNPFLAPAEKRGLTFLCPKHKNTCSRFGKRRVRWAALPDVPISNHTKSRKNPPALFGTGGFVFKLSAPRKSIAEKRGKLSSGLFYKKLSAFMLAYFCACLIAACAAARRAIGTRNGEQET